MKKQTAIDWLINEIKIARKLCDDLSMEMDIWHTLDVLIAKEKQAKQIEKDQIIFTKVSSCNSQNCEKPFKEKLKCSCGPYFYDKTFN
jgi:hypothetical protein